MIEDYSGNADIYDAVALDSWAELAPRLRGVLAGEVLGEGAVVDLGAGSGQALTLLTDIADGDVLALEPDPMMRSALMARVVGDADLRRRVTVVPGDAGSVGEIQEPVALVVALNMIGHLDEAARQRVWCWLGERLAPEGVAVVAPVMPTGAPAASEAHPFGGLGVGRRRYSGEGRSTVEDDEHITWHMTFRAHEGDRLVDERHASWLWRVTGAERLGDEVAGHGLRAELLEPDHPSGGLLVLRRS